jgi:hypothetical protein
VLLACAAPLHATPETPILEYFEAEWDSMRYRTSDVFMAGYEALWVPPVSRGSSASSTTSIGYDCFDRFDLGSSTVRTRYGTESQFRTMINEMHKANCRVFVDLIMNHNGPSDSNTPNFETEGGYPGFVLSAPGDSSGDFNPYSAGCTQSTSPCCSFSLSNPVCGGCCYDLYNGRLLGLIDFAQQKNHLYYRHPVTAGDPNNIPAGTLRNLPNANNRKFYPDLAQSPLNFTNPGTSRNPGSNNFSIYPYNLADPLQGDPVIENATSLLLRSTQYYLEVMKVDGFRLDAAKHTPSWFWDNLWDSIVYNRTKGFDGLTQTPYSFVETVESNSNIAHWVRKPGEPGTGWPSQGWEFGNRDALDLNEAGPLRDMANGGGSWDTVIGSSVDNVDGFNNGTIGVHHVNSHDNAVGDGIDDTTEHAYVLMRTGPSIVYHNALQFGTNPQNFPRKNGRTDAIGLGSSRITDLVKIHNQYARGWFIPVTTNGQQQDVLAFTRRTPSSVDNVLVGLNDRQDNGFDSRSVTTTFPVGTRLHELTGNAADATVDPGGNIPELLTVGAGGGVTVTIPRKRNTGGFLHGRSYVIYGPAVPTGTLSIANATTTLVPPDSAGVADYLQRVSPVTIVTSASFDILLQTAHTDPLDPDTDDLAVFRIDSGFADHNANGSTYSGSPSSDFNPGNSTSTSPSYGFENFLTENSPRFTSGTGTYRQTINAASLGEGYHYITVRAYRHRSTGDPLFGEFRHVIYVDAVNPQVSLLAPTATCNTDVTSLPVAFVVKAVDATVGKVYVFVDFRADNNFIALATGTSNLASQFLDTFTFTRSTLTSGNHRVDVVAIETLPNGTNHYNHTSYTGIQSFTGAGAGPGDVNADTRRDGKDIPNFILLLMGINPNFGPAADMNCDGLVDVNDIGPLVDSLLAN